MFLNFIAMIKRQFNQIIKVVRSENVTEFNCLQGYFFKHGILFESSCAGTPQQNGRVERKHQHILNVGRALRIKGNLPKKFCGECILAACFLINRTPTHLLSNKTPYEMLFRKPPSYDTIRVFGCLCYAYNQRSKGDKFESRSRKCVFLGYPFGKKGWQMFDLETREFFVSHDVQFHERIFPYKDEATESVVSPMSCVRNARVDVFERWPLDAVPLIVSDIGVGDPLDDGLSMASEGEPTRVGELQQDSGDWVSGGPKCGVLREAHLWCNKMQLVRC